MHSKTPICLFSCTLAPRKYYWPLLQTTRGKFEVILDVKLNYNLPWSGNNQSLMLHNFKAMFSTPMNRVPTCIKSEYKFKSTTPFMDFSSKIQNHYKVWCFQRLVKGENMLMQQSCHDRQLGWPKQKYQIEGNIG